MFKLQIEPFSSHGVFAFQNIPFVLCTDSSCDNDSQIGNEMKGMTHITLFRQMSTLLITQNKIYGKIVLRFTSLLIEIN